MAPSTLQYTASRYLSVGNGEANRLARTSRALNHVLTTPFLHGYWTASDAQLWIRGEASPTGHWTDIEPALRWFRDWHPDPDIETMRLFWDRSTTWQATYNNNLAALEFAIRNGCDSEALDTWCRGLAMRRSRDAIPLLELGHRLSNTPGAMNPANQQLFDPVRLLVDTFDTDEVMVLGRRRPRKAVMRFLLDIVAGANPTRRLAARETARQAWDERKWQRDRDQDRYEGGYSTEEEV